MSARFLLRFDDLCPTMNWGVWEQIESILVRHGIKPLLAVVPDNRDPNLVVDAPKADFWERVRRWQEQGFAIALHGYQHLYETGHSGLLGFNPYSEFAGLTYEEQRDKIERGLAIFSREGIRPDAWAAPAHSFDAVTLRVLGECGIRVVLDGFYWRPVFTMGALWIPQQMWRFRSMPGGVWTVGYHHNRFSAGDIARLEAKISHYRKDIVSLEAMVRHYPAKSPSVMERFFSALWLVCLRFKLSLARSRTYTHPEVLFLIPTLSGGGAERVIVTLLRHLDRSRFRLALAVVDTRAAVFLDEGHEVLVRSGMHCAHSYYSRRGLPGNVRASFYLYNDRTDADRLIGGLRELLEKLPGAGVSGTSARTVASTSRSGSGRPRASGSRGAAARSARPRHRAGRGRGASGAGSG